MSIKKITEMVEHVLKKHESARNSDTDLMLWVWKTFYKSSLYNVGDPNPWRESVCLKNLKNLPQTDKLGRIRRHIQNVEHRYLPTDWFIARQRRINEEVWKKAMLDMKKEESGQMSFVG